jgi:hypothetical protein
MAPSKIEQVNLLWDENKIEVVAVADLRGINKRGGFGTRNITQHQHLIKKTNK